MKGAVNIEFIFSVFVFLITIVFILINIAGGLAPLHRDAVIDSIRSNTHQFSQIILFDEGDPKNWHTEEINRINRAGLSTGDKYVISNEKITRLQDLCNNNYDALLNMFFGGRLRMRINITSSSGNILDCGDIVTQFSLKRFAVLDTTKEILAVEISVER